MHVRDCWFQGGSRAFFSFGLTAFFSSDFLFSSATLKHCRACVGSRLKQNKAFMPALDPALEIPEDDDLQDAEPQQLNPAKVGSLSCIVFFNIKRLTWSRQDSIVLGHLKSATDMISFSAHLQVSWHLTYANSYAMTLSASLLSGLDVQFAHGWIFEMDSTQSRTSMRNRLLGKPRWLLEMVHYCTCRLLVPSALLFKIGRSVWPPTPTAGGS